MTHLSLKWDLLKHFSEISEICETRIPTKFRICKKPYDIIRRWIRLGLPRFKCYSRGSRHLFESVSDHLHSSQFHQVTCDLKVASIVYQFAVSWKSAWIFSTLCLKIDANFSTITWTISWPYSSWSELYWIVFDFWKHCETDPTCSKNLVKRLSMSSTLSLVTSFRISRFLPDSSKSSYYGSH